jgi:hypothetical protein
MSMRHGMTQCLSVRVHGINGREVITRLLRVANDALLSRLVGGMSDDVTSF